MEFDIIYDGSNNRWRLEDTYSIQYILEEWLEEFAENRGKKPEKATLRLGLKTYDAIKSFPTYSEAFNTVIVYNVKIDTCQDWSVNTNYIKLTLK